MTPQLLQSIQIMTLPLQELRTRIHEELNANPALEVVAERQEVSLDQAREERSLQERYEPFENSSDPGFIATGPYDGDHDGNRAFLENAIGQRQTLADHLLWQLHLQDLPSREREVGEYVVNNLDENGFHREDPAVLVDDDEHDLLERVLVVVRSLDPVGCATAGVIESLLVQARELKPPPRYVDELLVTYIAEIERGKIREVARALGTRVEEIEGAIEQIRTLSPYPGRHFSRSAPTYVVPDLLLLKREGRFVLSLNDEEIPVLGINTTFEEVASGENEDAKRFAGQRIREAQWFIKSISQRNRTLLRVGQAILEYQRDFFLKGKKYLVPLTLKEIASELELSEATVSRTTNGKYLQSEWGIFELKYFFTNRVSGGRDGSSRFSKEGVKEVVREILEESQTRGGKRLSDQKVADLLAQRGIKIARRTVAKYRTELKIDSSYER